MSAIDDLWGSDTPAATAARAALWPFARAFEAVAALRSRLYDAGVLPSTRAALPTLSVGNLTVGGTGKTPVSAWLAGQLAARGARPAIVAHGYGDDEIEVHRILNPEVRVFVGHRRADVVERARAEGADIAVLDDGFQHRRLRRDADVLLISVEQVLRPRRPIPTGPWREPLGAAKRADLIVLTRKTATAEQVDAARALVASHAPGVAVAVAHLVPDRLVGLRDRATLPLDELRGARVLAIAAIAEPSLFARQLEGLGAAVTLASFRDHHEFTDHEIARLSATVPAGGMAVCTLKDAVKLAPRWPPPASSRLWYVSQRLVVEQGADKIESLLTRVLSLRATHRTTAG